MSQTLNHEKDLKPKLAGKTNYEMDNIGKLLFQLSIFDYSILERKFSIWAILLGLHEHITNATSVLWPGWDSNRQPPFRGILDEKRECPNAKGPHMAKIIYVNKIIYSWLNAILIIEIFLNFSLDSKYLLRC